MSNCQVSENRLHTFTFSPGSKEVEPTIHQYLTCIGCGERRAIGVLGDLLVREDGEWVKLDPASPPKDNLSKGDGDE